MVEAESSETTHHAPQDENKIEEWRDSCFQKIADLHSRSLLPERERFTALLEFFKTQYGQNQDLLDHLKNAGMLFEKENQGFSSFYSQI